MRPVERGNAPTLEDGVPVVFRDYGDARDLLIKRIGDYCSYCENALHSSIHVEHVRPKSKNPGLVKTWTNFLLACDYCNPTKGDKDVDLHEYFWPDTDNTVRAFHYPLDRAPQIAHGLDQPHTEMAQRTLELTGIEREPGHPALTDKDRRWLKRREAWGVAIHERRKIGESDTPQQRDSAVHVAIGRGFWSVWMQVFNDDHDMRRRLIAGFRGTSANCFGVDTQPIQRVGGKL